MPSRLVLGNLDQKSLKNGGRDQFTISDDDRGFFSSLSPPWTLMAKGGHKVRRSDEAMKRLSDNDKPVTGLLEAFFASDEPVNGLLEAFFASDERFNG